MKGRMNSAAFFFSGRDWKTLPRTRHTERNFLFITKALSASLKDEVL